MEDATWAQADRAETRCTIVSLQAVELTSRPPSRLRPPFLSPQIFIRNRLKYALTGREVTLVVKQRLIKIDNKVRTDETYPAGFQG